MLMKRVKLLRSVKVESKKYSFGNEIKLSHSSDILIAFMFMIYSGCYHPVKISNKFILKYINQPNTKVSNH